MRIAIDATPLVERSGGIARYTFELTEALATEFPEDSYWLVSDQQTGPRPSAGNIHGGRRPGNLLTRRWWSLGLALELGRISAQIFHGTDFAIPYLPLCPSVLTLHDLSPWRSGNGGNPAARRIRRRTPWLLPLATMMITPTEAIRKEAIERFSVPPARIAAVPLAAAGIFRPRSMEELAPMLARLQVLPPYLLFVGTREKRKNIGPLVRAWRAARRECGGLSLVLAGRPGNERTEPLNVGSGNAEGGLLDLGLVPDAELACLVAGAAGLVYPSLYEGFGLPALEAMQSGVPAIIARDPALMEVTGGAALTVDVNSATSLAQAIVELIKNPTWRLRLREQGLRRAAQFSWRQTAVRTREVYVEALGRF